MDIQLPENIVKILLYIDVIVLVISFSVIGYQPSLLVVMIFIIWASIGSIICCAYAHLRCKGYLAEFNRRFGGSPMGDWEFDHSEYPELILKEEKFSVIAFGIFYFLALILSAMLFVRASSP
jgi:hypothetical protein